MTEQDNSKECNKCGKWHDGKKGCATENNELQKEMSDGTNKTNGKLQNQ